MSETAEKVAPVTLAQDAWVSKFTGIEARRDAADAGVSAGAGGKQPEPQAPKLTKARDEKLAEVDEALKGLETAAAAIGAPLLRTAVEPDIALAKEGREALAKAATDEQMDEQLKAAPGVLQAITAATEAAVKDKADCEALAAKKLEVGNAIADLGKTADEIGAPLKRAGVQAAIDEATQAHVALDQATAREHVAEKLDAVGGLLGKVGDAKQAAVKDKADCEALAEKTRVADEALKQLNGAADGIGTPPGRTAIQGEIDPLAEALAGLGKAVTRDALAKEIETAESLPARIAEVGKSVEKDKQSALALVAEKEKVRLALAAVETAAGQIGAPLLRIAIDPELNTVTQQAEALNTAATREVINQQVAAAPTLLGEIEKVRLAAVKDKTDGEGLATKLQAVDNALGPMTNAFNALNPVCKKEVQADIDKATKGRDDLSKAKTRGEITTQVAAQPQLLLDIAATQKKAEDTLADWNGLQVRKAKVEKDAAGIKVRVNWVDGGSAKNDLNNKFADLTNEIKNLDTAATLADYKNALTQAEQDATALMTQSTTAFAPPYADKLLAGFAKWKPVFKTASSQDPNPASKQYDALVVRKNSAGSGGDPTNDLVGVGNAASAASTDAKKAYAADQQLLRTLQQGKANVASVSAPSFKNNVLTWIGERETRRMTAYTSEITVAGLASKLSGMQSEAGQLPVAMAGIGRRPAPCRSAGQGRKRAIKKLPAAGGRATNSRGHLHRPEEPAGRCQVAHKNFSRGKTS